MMQEVTNVVILSEGVVILPSPDFPAYLKGFLSFGDTSDTYIEKNLINVKTTTERGKYGNKYHQCHLLQGFAAYLSRKLVVILQAQVSPHPCYVQLQGGI